MPIDLNPFDDRGGPLELDLVAPETLGTIGAVTGFIIGGPAGAAVGAGLGTGTGGTIKGMEAAQRSAKYQRQAARVQITMQRQQAARERRAAIRQSMLARERARTMAAAQSMLGSSAFQGGMASLTSQLGANLGYGSMMSGLGMQYTGLTSQAADAAALASRYQAIANLGFQFASLFGNPFKDSDQTGGQTGGQKKVAPASGGMSRPSATAYR
jgi:hypothetical protein